MSLKQAESYAAAIIALLALVAAVGGGYISVATRTTQAEVEHIVDTRTEDKFSETQRRFDAIDRQLNRILDRLERKRYDESGS